MEREGAIRDVIPYAIRNGRISVMIKHAYPRPIINCIPRGSHNIDAKRYSGYVTEQIGVSDALTTIAEMSRKRLFEALGISEAELGREEP